MKQTTFQSTLPSRGAIMAGTKVIDITDISIHAPLTGRDISQHSNHQPGEISIHAPFTGSDISQHSNHQPGEISIHAPLTGSDPCAAESGAAMNDFNPRSPHGER